MEKLILNIVKKQLQSPKQTTLSLNRNIWFLRQAVKAKPSMASEILNTLNTVSDKDFQPSLLQGIYQTHAEIVKANPILAEEVLDSIRKTLASDKNNRDSLDDLYNTLGLIGEIRPELAPKALEILNNTLSSENNDFYSLEHGYRAMQKIIKADPKLVDNVLESLQKTLTSDKNTRDSLDDFYDTLGIIGKLRPDLAGKTMEVFRKEGFQVKEIVIKEQHHCRSSDYWEDKENKFLLLSHEYIFVFEKEKITRNGVLAEDTEFEYNVEPIDPDFDQN